MADALKLKRKGLGVPPSIEEASANLTAPEVAPIQEFKTRAMDGRTRRRTNRTLQLNLKVTPQCDALLREIADHEEILLAEVLEWAIERYAKELAIR